MNDPFAILGVPRRFTLDIRALEQRHRDLSRELHPDRFAQAAPAERRIAIARAAEVNEAFRALKNPLTRAAALLALAGRPVDETSRAEPALLAEILDLREQLEAAKDEPPDARATAVAPLRAGVESEARAAERAIADAFDADAPRTDAVATAHAALVRLKYLQRFLEEADNLLVE